MKRYLKLLGIFTKNSVQLELEYRANLLMNALNSLLTFGAGFIVLFVMFSHTDSVGGWSFTEALVLFGVFMVFEALIDMVLYPNLNKLPEYIRKGNMDFFLLKPVSAQFMVSFRYASIWRIPELLLGLGIVAYGMITTGQLTVLNVLLVLVLLVSGFMIVYAIWFFLSTTAFWLVKVENISELFSAFFTAGRFPVSAFPGWARFTLTFLIPIAFITTVPASAAIGKLEFGLAWGSFVIAGLLLLLSHAFWRYALANYTSASS